MRRISLTEAEGLDNCWQERGDGGECAIGSKIDYTDHIDLQINLATLSITS
jgi:hypothetical protein